MKLAKNVSTTKEFKAIKKTVKCFQDFLKSKKWINSRTDFVTIFGEDLEYRLYLVYTADCENDALNENFEPADSQSLSAKLASFLSDNEDRLKKNRAAKVNCALEEILAVNLYKKIEKNIKILDSSPTKNGAITGITNGDVSLTTPLKKPSIRNEISSTPIRSSERKKRPKSYVENSDSDFELTDIETPSKKKKDDSIPPDVPATNSARTVAESANVPVSVENEGRPDEDTASMNESDDSSDLTYGLRTPRTGRKKAIRIKKIPETNQQRCKKYRDRHFEQSDTDDDKDDVQEPVMKSPIDLGEFNNVCPFCNAIHFMGERTCCNNGKVFFPPLKAMPEKLQHYLFEEYVGKYMFKNRILSYNCSVAMASMSYQQADIAPHGVQIVKPIGNVGHYTSCAEPINPNSPAFGNFYAYQGANALQMRQDAYSSLDKQILADLHEVMEKNNALGKLYHSMGKVIEKQKKEGNDVSYVRMKVVDARQFKDQHGLTAHTGIYLDSMMTGDHLALFYNSTMEQEVKLPGLNIYAKKRPKFVPQPINSWDCRIPALCYPLLYPYGEIPYRRKSVELYLGEMQTWSYKERLVEWALRTREDASKWEIEPSLFDVMAQVNRLLNENPNWIPSVSDPNIESEIAEEDDEEDPDEQDYARQYSHDDVNAEISNTVDFIEVGGEYYPIPAIRQPTDPPNQNDESDDNISDLGDDLLDAIDDEILPIGDDDYENSRGQALNDEHRMTFSDEEEYEREEYDAQDSGQHVSTDQSAREGSVSPSERSENDENFDFPVEKKNRRYPSYREYILFSIQQREMYKNRHSAAGRLGQLALTDNCARLYEQRYSYKKNFHTEHVYSSSKRFLTAMQETANKLGRRIGCITTMPHTEPGSPRYLQKLYEHAVAMCNNISTCDLFITATCNVNWPEIKKILKPGETWADHPKEVNEIFKKKFDRLMELIIGEQIPGKPVGVREKGVFGRVKWYTYSIEFQQRGPPHAHLIVSLKRKITNVSQVDKVSQATIPTDNEELRKLVEDFQIHRPCEDDPEAYCRMGAKDYWMKCRKGFPKEFSEQTELGDRSYPELKRPKNTAKCYKHGFEADNRHVVAYNTTLLSVWCGHLNVEVISTLKIVKYIFKYLFKGYDRALVEALTGTDHLDAGQMTIEGHLMFPKNLKMHPGAKKKRQEEAKRMLRKHGIRLLDDNNQPTLVLNEYWICQDMRALSPNEAAWEVQGYPRHGSSHTVVDLFVHEENEEPIRYQPGEEEEMARRLAESGAKSRFNAWMKLNRDEEDARHLTYNELPKFYKYRNGRWIKKKHVHRNLFGRVRSVHPRNKELFAIRLLSGKQTGVQSFEELRTVNGKLHDTYVSAAKELGLMNDQEEWRRALDEAAQEKMPSVLRRLFISILVFNPVHDPLDLWNQFKEDFFENKSSWSQEKKEAHALYHIRSGVQAHGFSLENFNLPNVNDNHLPTVEELADDSGVTSFGIAYSRRQEEKLVRTLNDDQTKAFKTITEDIDQRIGHKDDCYFVDGSGGTGKTRLLTALYHHFNARGHTVLCVAHTGIAAMLLPFGSTAHRAFHIPMAVEEGMRAKVHMETREAQQLRNVSIVFWDEATMTDRRIFTCVDQLFRDIHEERKGLMFGGIPFIFGGDWKQTLPIVSDVKGAGVVQYTMRGSTMWKYLEKIVLTENMRAKDDPEFANFCAKIGKGSSIVDEEKNWVELDARCNVATEDELIKKLFGTVDTPENKRDIFATSSILTVDNKTTFDVNNKVLKLIHGDEYEFDSIDEYHPGCSFKHLEPEAYHTQTPSGMPVHKLKLKVGAPVILLRNVNVYLGLVNGTRLIIEKIGRDVIYATPLNPGPHTPPTVAIHRMMFSPPEKPTRETSFIRTQFPIRLAFCITCNRAQGQTLQKAGLLLRTPCFAHGQLYVAVSRVRTFKDLFVCNPANAKSPLFTPNVVYNNVLTFGNEDANNITGSSVPTTRTALGGWVTIGAVQPKEKDSDIRTLQDYYFGDRDLRRKEEEYQKKRREFLETDQEDRELEEREYFSHDISPALMERIVIELYSNEETNANQDVTMEVQAAAESAATQNPIKAPAVKKVVQFVPTTVQRPTTQNPTKAPAVTNVVQSVPPSSSSSFNLLKLRQEQNNCFANTTMQVVNYLWRKELKDYKGRDRVITEMKKIVSATETTSTLSLLGLTPGTENFDDDGQHDADEYLLHLLDCMEEVPGIGNTYKLTKHITDTCFYEYCQKVSMLTPQTEKHIRVTNSDQGLTIEQYIKTLEKEERIQKKCPNRDHNDRSNVWHNRVAKFEIPADTKYLIMHMNMWANSGPNGELVFNDRQMRYKEDNYVYGCLFKPVVMLEYNGDRDAGHYKAYVRQENGWLCIDADRQNLQISAPDLTNITLIVLKKQPRNALQRVASTAGDTLRKIKDKIRKNVDGPNNCESTEEAIPENNRVPNDAEQSTSSLPVPKPILKSVTFNEQRTLRIYRGDMFNLRTDAIVNAANPQLKNGGGVCKEIFRRAGVEKMEAACKKVLSVKNVNEISPGSAVITLAFDLKKPPCCARYVVHTAAPRQVGKIPTKEDEKNLRQCYLNACRQASKQNLSKIVFPFLGIGIYNYGKKEGISVAVQAILLFFELNPESSLKSVVLATKGAKEYKIATNILFDTDLISITDSARDRRKMEKQHGKGQVHFEKEDKTRINVATFIDDTPTVDTLRRALSFKFS